LPEKKNVGSRGFFYRRRPQRFGFGLYANWGPINLFESRKHSVFVAIGNAKF